MPNKRIAQVNALLQREVGLLLRREVEFPINILVTVSRTDTSIDLEHATIWLKVFPEDQSKAVMETLRHSMWYLQRSLNRRLAMKFVPRIRFDIDTSEEKAEHMLNVLDELNPDDRS